MKFRSVVDSLDWSQTSQLQRRLQMRIVHDHQLSSRSILLVTDLFLWCSRGRKKPQNPLPLNLIHARSNACQVCPFLFHPPPFLPPRLASLMVKPLPSIAASLSVLDRDPSYHQFTNFTRSITSWSTHFPNPQHQSRGRSRSIPSVRCRAKRPH